MVTQKSPALNTPGFSGLFSYCVEWTKLFVHVIPSLVSATWHAVKPSTVVCDPSPNNIICVPLGVGLRCEVGNSETDTAVMFHRLGQRNLLHAFLLVFNDPRDGC